MSEQDVRLTREQQMWRWRVLIATYFGYGGYYLCRKVFTICKTSLNEDFGWDFGSIGHLWTAYLVAYMLGQFINSFVGRKWGPRLLLLGGLGTSIVINVIFGFANSYSTFLVFMFFNGLVQASGWPGTVGAVARWLRPKERGTIMGFWSTNYVVGNIVVKTLGGLLLARLGWRYAFFGCTLLAFAIWWLLYFWQRTRPEDVGLEPIVRDAAVDNRAVKAASTEHVTLREYFGLILNPIIPVMGLSYFCLKFLRYALDSWLPTFLNLQGLDKGQAAMYSSIFDGAGLVGAILAGIALDKLFRGRWDRLCLVMGLGMIGGYAAVLAFGANPVALAFCFGLVGFMLYGPDTLLGGAAAVQVAGEKNAVAVAGLVNGIGSLGPIIQEEVIGRLIDSKAPEIGIRNANIMAFCMSIAFVVMMAIVSIRVSLAYGRNAAATGEYPPGT